jgi:hypothetical protein
MPEIMQTSLLVQIDEILALLGFQTHLQPLNSEQLIEQLIVGLDQEPMGEQFKYRLQLCLLEDLLKARNSDTTQLEPSILTLQFTLQLPVQFQDLQEQHELEALRLMLWFNKVLPVGNFGIEGEAKSVYFRYALMGNKESFTGHLIFEAVERIAFFINGLAPHFEAFVQSNKTAIQYLNDSEILQLFQG